MAAQLDDKSSLFTLDYRAPFGGVNSSAFATAIPDKDFAATDGIYVSNNIIKAVAFKAFVSNFTKSGENYLGYVPLTTYFLGGPTIFIGFIVTDKNVYYVGTNTQSTTLVFTPGPGYTPAKSGDNSYFHYIIINDIQSAATHFYWTANGWSEIWDFDTATNTIANTTTYVGGGILGLLNNQLINLGGISAADGQVPNRISWSAPGQYGQFQPYDVGSGTGNFAAGFNDLPSTSDFLTGFATIGTVAYAFRSQGITQMTPTGTGIQPFTFNHLWASEQGIGDVYPNSIVQYGPSVVFMTDAAIHTLGLSGLATIGAAANSKIFRDINKARKFLPIGSNLSMQTQTLSVVCGLSPYTLRSPALIYYIAFIDPTQAFWHVYGVDLGSSNVYDFGLQIPVNTAGTVVNINLQFSYLTYCNIGATDNLNYSRQVGILAISSAEPTAGNWEVDFYYFTDKVTRTGTVTFKKEQFGFLQEPTVSKVICLGTLLDTTINGSISCSVDGGVSTFATVNITAGSGNLGTGIFDDIIFDNVQTLERPQLQFQLTNVQIAEAWAQGTFADFRPI